MDRIEFLICDRGQDGLALGERAEPVINGESLVEIIGRAERDSPTGGGGGYAGMRPDDLFAILRAPESRRGQLLGCSCGDYGCSAAGVSVTTTADEVLWHDLWSTGEKGTLNVGPYSFVRESYEHALDHPLRAESPVRSADWHIRGALLNAELEDVDKRKVTRLLDDGDVVDAFHTIVSAKTGSTIPFFPTPRKSLTAAAAKLGLQNDPGWQELVSQAWERPV